MKFGHVLKDFAEEERGEDARSEGGRDFLSYKVKSELRLEPSCRKSAEAWV
jgi:hypothetical protein